MFLHTIISEHDVFAKQPEQATIPTINAISPAHQYQPRPISIVTDPKQFIRTIKSMTGFANLQTAKNKTN